MTLLAGLKFSGQRGFNLRPLRGIHGTVLNKLEAGGKILGNQVRVNNNGRKLRELETLDLGFVAVGTLLSAIAVSTRFAELMLPVLMLPFLVPPITSAVQITARLFAGRPMSELTGWLRLLVGYDIVVIVAALLIFEFTLDE